MFGVVIPVGPSDRDVERLGWLVGELERLEGRAEIRLVIVDDAPQLRGLAPDWPNCEIVKTPLWAAGRPDPLSAHVAGTVEALQRVRDCEFAVKLDTDAAVIRTFSSAIRTAFADAELGVVGSYDRMSTGAVRDWSVWKSAIDRADRRLVVRRGPRRVLLHRRARADRETIRATRHQAYRFAPPGAHCLGGAYAVSAGFLRRAVLDWRPWVASGLGEDVVVGLVSSATELRMRSLTGPGDPFALSWRGLPDAPEQLVAAGHAIVHSVKCDTRERERELRDHLRGLVARAGPAAGSVEVVPDARATER